MTGVSNLSTNLKVSERADKLVARYIGTYLLSRPIFKFFLLKIDITSLTYFININDINEGIGLLDEGGSENWTCLVHSPFFKKFEKFKIYIISLTYFININDINERIGQLDEGG